MRKWTLAVLLVGVMLFSGAPGAIATVLTFDDVPPSTDAIQAIPAGYGGFAWDNFEVLNSVIFGGPNGYVNGTVSGTNVAFNSWGFAAGMTSAASFDFTGAYLTAAWDNGLNIEVQGYRDGTLQYDRTVVVDSTAPTFFRFDFLGIDQLKFDSSGGLNAGYEGEGNHFAMDNLTINESAAPIPEPATILMLAGGLTALLFFRRATNNR